MFKLFFPFVLGILIFTKNPALSQSINLTDDDLRNHPHWFDLMQKDNPNYFDVKRAYDLYFGNHEKARGSGYKLFERWAWRNKGDFNPDGSLIPADKILNSLLRYKSELKQRGPVTNAGNWNELGPLVYPGNVSGQTNGKGRINAIAFHPTDENIFWIGAPSGGLWQTNDGGISFFSNTDQLPTLGVSSIVIDPNPDIIYIGTGDRDAGDAPGLGVFKSTDGGATWAQSNSGMGNKTVGKMVMHPTLNNIILAATSDGIYKTTDSGANWTKVSSNSNNYKDIIFKPGDPNFVYATSSGKFYKSIDNGNTWVEITSGLIACNRMVLGASVAEPNSVFCLLTGGSAIFHGIFKSTDSGTNFSRITPASHPNILGYDDGDDKSQAGYDLCMIVSPGDANKILVGSINIHLSSNGGTSFTKKTHWSNQVHADQHVVGLNPLNNRIYEGHDGGLHYSDDYFSTYTQISDGLNIAQTYRIGQAFQQKNRVINGYQDNGSAVYDDGVFTTVLGGDGMESAYDYSDINYAYSTYIDQIKRSGNGGFGSWSTIAKEGTNGINESGAWVVPYMLHVTDPNTMFFGYKNIWRTNNVKNNPPAWTKLSDNLAGSNSNNFAYIDQSLADPNIFYGVRSDNKIFRSDNINDATPAWIDLSANLPNGSSNIDDIICHPTDAEIVYLIQSEKVYKSGNKGLSWTDVSGTLPGGTNLTCLAIDKFSNEGMYAGTKTGVFYKDATLPDWIAFDGGLPIVNVSELEIYYGNTDSRIRAGTYGRGLWESNLYYDPDLLPIANFKADKVSTIINQLVNLEDLSAFGPDTWTWTISPATFTWENGTNANSQNPEVKFTATGTYTVSLTAANINGNNTKTINSYISIYNETPASCTPATQLFGNYGMGIKKVILNTIDNTSGQPYQDNPTSGYMNYSTTQFTTLKPNTTYQLTVELFTGYTEWWKFYIDYNNDGDFLDENETVYSSPTKVSGSQTITFTTIASPLMNQLLRIRVLCDYNSITGPCMNPQYGQAEDYGIIFKDLPELSTTIASNIQITSAQSGGIITNQGSSSVAKRGLVWDIRTNPSLDSNWGYSENGSGTGSFTHTMTSLSPNTTYYVRAYAINGEGIIYGQNETFTTLTQYPEVTTNDVTAISFNTAVSGGNVISDNGNSIIIRGVVWNTIPNPTLSNNIGKTENGGGTGPFVSNLSGLVPNTTYYVRAYARNGYAVAYGSEKVFSTPPPDPNQSANILFYDVTTNKMTLSWTNGNGESRIVKISTTNSFNMPVNGTDPAANTIFGGSEQVVFNGTGNSVTVTNLSPSTTYYFHVFDYNGHGASTVFNTNQGLNNPAAKTTYCVPTYAHGDQGTHIKNFTINTINNSSGASQYSDYTNISTSLLIGGTYDVSFLMSYNPLKLNIWVDFDDNSIFDTSEKLLNELNCLQNVQTTGTINISPNANPGPHIMRVRGDLNLGVEPCNNGTWGETEDYTVIIKDKITWTGTVSTSWFDPVNWDVGKVPALTNEVIINSAPFKPVIEVGQTGNAKKITSTGGAQLEVKGTLNVIN
jgi:hypothetical protein